MSRVTKMNKKNLLIEEIQNLCEAFNTVHLFSLSVEELIEIVNLLRFKDGIDVIITECNIETELGTIYEK